MKKLDIHCIVMAVMVMMSFPLRAQNNASGYFLEDYTYRYEMNPAIGNSRNFIAMPALGNMNVAMQGNLHVDDVIFNVDGRTTTFLNPQVGVKEVMDGISEKNRIGANVKLTLLAAGFKAFGGYNTVTINARTAAEAQLPKSIFSLAKEGVVNRTYDITDLRAYGSAYGEIALGHSHALGDKWRIGGTLKFLVGGGYVDASLRYAQLVLGENDWLVVADADLSANVKGLSYKTKVNDRTNHRYVNGADIDGTGINGFGAAIDLGATYKPGRDWTLSVAVTDLGFIKWHNNMLASTNGPKTFNTDRYIFNVDDDADNSFSNEWERMKDGLSSLYELEDMGDTGSKTRMLGATVNAGVEFTLPAWRRLSFGLLNTTRIQGEYSHTDFRLSANIAPAKCFDASVNMSAGTFGVGFGWLLNVHTKGFNMFLGMDRTPFRLAKQYVPLNSNASFNFGLNFPF